ncbi:MAG: hypothetical protein KDC98_23265 [Planctomycetes bacterium]|nr:hypothetical protein [Planctomycetota bacterium]
MRWPRLRRLAPLLAAGLGLGVATAQERTVQVKVVSASVDSVYFDHGRDLGLEVGTIVKLLPPGMASLDVEIRSVSNTSARAELPPGMPTPPVGTPGEARVVRNEAEPTPSPTPPSRPLPGQAPEHPPWSRQEPKRQADQPLLVPTFGQRPEDRPATLDGRIFGSGQWNRDMGSNRTSDYALARLGVRADATNYFGTAERIRFAGEYDSRRLMLPDAPDHSDDTVRLDLLSVAFGNEQWAPTGVEVGRFYSQYLPEIGLVDGVEVVRRFEGGMRAGGGIGSYPRPFPARDTGEDMGAHAFFDYVSDPRRTTAAAVGLQKTWHKGAPDRDLLLLRIENRPFDHVTLFGNAKVDIYTGGDDIKGSGLELTEAMTSARYDARAAGTGLTYSHFAWPELKRAEYQNLPLELVQNGSVDRASWQGWMRPHDLVRLGLRADTWRDQDQNGTSYTIDGSLRDALGAGSWLSLSVFRSEGGYSSGPGARADFRAPLYAGSWRLGYRWHRYEVTNLVSGNEAYTRQSAQVGMTMPISNSGSLDASLERWFGEREDAWSLGLYVQWRF